jgi:hypothetical protein
MQESDVEVYDGRQDDDKPLAAIMAVLALVASILLLAHEAHGLFY